MKHHAAVASAALALLAFLGSVPRPASAGDPPKAAAAVDLTGRWILNADLTDDAREKMAEAMEGRGGREGSRPPLGPGGPGMADPAGGPGGRGGPSGPPSGAESGDPAEAMRPIFEPAEELTISHTGTELVVDEKFSRLRRLHADGKKYKTENGLAELKTVWKEGRLVVETKRARGGGVIETWELVPDGSRLIVNVKVEGGFGPGVALKRVYDRGKDSPAR